MNEIIRLRSINFSAIGLILVLVILLIIVIQPSESITKLEPTKIKTNYTTKQIIENTAMEIANAHEYKLHVFDCTDFSRELMKSLRHQNFHAYCVFGKYKDTSFHTWVEVKTGETIRIESTIGSIINQEDYQNYKVISVGKCV